MRVPRQIAAVAMALVVSAFAGHAAAAPVMYVHDSVGTLGTVNVQTGEVDIIGSLGVTLTDIAFDPQGNLWGVSFGAFYSVNATTAETTFVGSHGINAANALVFGTNGTLYSAGNLTDNLFTIDTASGAATSLGSMGFRSGGDLAFNDGQLYLASNNAELIRIDLSDLANTELVGAFGVDNVFGLATGDDGILYGVGGTQIFAVNTETGAAMNPVEYGGQGLSQAFGQSFFTEAGAQPDPTPVPAPGPFALIVLGLLAMGSLRRGRR